MGQVVSQGKEGGKKREKERERKRGGESTGMEKKKKKKKGALVVAPGTRRPYLAGVARSIFLPFVFPDRYYYPRERDRNVGVEGGGGNRGDVVRGN